MAKNNLLFFVQMCPYENKHPGNTLVSLNKPSQDELQLPLQKIGCFNVFSIMAQIYKHYYSEWSRKH